MLAAGSLFLALLFAAPLDDDATFKAGQALYQQLEFEEALIRFQEVALSNDHSEEERAYAFVWAGLAYAQLGRFDTAAASFERAVRAHEAVQLPSGVSPKITKVFADAAERARRTMAQERAAAEKREKAQAQAEAEAEARRLAEQRAAEERAARASAEWERHKQASSGAAGAAPVEAGPDAAADKPSSSSSSSPLPSSSSSSSPSSSSAGAGSAEQPPVDSGVGLSTAYWAGTATGGVIGGALAAGGVGVLGVSYLVFAYAASPSTPQVPAAQALSVANGLWFASLGVMGVGALALVAGATSATLAVVQAE